MSIFFRCFLFYGVFISIIGGTLLNVFVKVFLPFFGGGFFICILGGTPDKRISEGLFCFFYIIYLFCSVLKKKKIGVFISFIGGTPDKRISEGLFSPVFFLLVFYRHYRGGNPDKRIPEGLF